MSIKRRYIGPIAATAIAGLALAGCSSSEEPESSDTASGGGEVMEGCEDYAAYGTFDGGDVEVYTTITGVELGQLEETFTDFSSCTGINVNVVSSDEFETEINIRINKAVLEHDAIIILGPTLPHEVVGFSGGAKYFFPGISGPDVINFTHWLGALATVRGTIGIKDTPVRAVIHAATRRLQTPTTLAALITEGAEIAGVLIGDVYETWSEAADECAKLHVKLCDHPYKSVLSGCPPMYDELWTAGKCMYKMESVVEIGSELIIYAPHLDVVSPVHGKYIYEAGYHILPYFLADWDKYKHLPLGALAHCTHVRGSGVMENGIEKPNVRLTLASKIPPEDCAKLNLGYRDPATINPADWMNREDEGYLYVPRAGEMLYKVRDR